MEPFLRHLFEVLEQKRREGKGVPEVPIQKGAEKGAFRTLFRVQLFTSVQGARSRGLGRNCTERCGSSRRVPEDPPGPIPYR